MNDQSKQPGCFGSVLLFGDDYDRCQRCPFRSGCRDETARSRAILETEFAELRAGATAAPIKVKRRAVVATVRKSEVVVPVPAPIPVTPAAILTRAGTVSAPRRGDEVVIDGRHVKLDGLPVKVRSELQRLERNNIPVSKLLNGENPFPPGSFANHVADAFLSRKRCLSAHIEVHIMSKKSYGRATASSQRKIWTDCLLALGLIEKDGELLVLRGGE